MRGQQIPGVAKTEFSPRIRSEEYGEFVALAKNDPEFPDTHARWVEIIEQSDAERRALGMTIHEVEIYPQQFAAWCWACGLNPGFNTVMAFTIAKGIGHHEVKR